MTATRGKIMLFRFIVLISIVLLPISSKASWEELCEDIDKVAMFTAQIRNIPWPGFLNTPSGPIPTTLNATIQQESVVLEVCEVAQAAKNAEGIDNIYVAKDAYDRLQTDKMNKTMDVIVETADLASYVTKRINGKDKAIGVQDARALNRYMGSMNDVYNRDRKQEDKIWTFTNRRDRERQMRKISRAASKIEQINSQMRCENIEEGDDIDPSVTNKLNELEAEKTDVDNEKEKIYIIILRLGEKFLSMDQHKEYTQDLINTFSYTHFPQERKTSRSVNVEQTQGGSTRKTEEKEDYYTYSVNGTENYYQDFERKWVEIWNGYIKGRMLGTLKNQFGDKRYEIEKEFHDLDYECSRHRIGLEYDREDPDFHRKVKIDRAECLKGLSSRISGNGGLLGYHLKKLRESLKLSAQIDSAIFSIKSREFGMHHFRTTEETKYNDFKVVSTKCSSTLTGTELKKASVDLKLENVKMRSMIAEEMTKKTAIQKGKMDKIKREEQKERDSREIYKARDDRKISPRIETKVLDF
jgi:hypothetical protein